MAPNNTHSIRKFGRKLVQKEAYTNQIRRKLSQTEAHSNGTRLKFAQSEYYSKIIGRKALLHLSL